MITVFIASPYTIGDVAVNVRESILAADSLLDAGLIPYAPLLSHFWHFLSPKPYEIWTALDNAWLKRCDCILRLPGESSGADAEVQLAAQLNIPIFYDIASIIEWANDPR